MLGTTIQPVINRELGSGFGEYNEFYLRSDERYQGFINPLTTTQLDVVHRWLQTTEENPQIKEILGAVLPDILIDMDIPEFAHFKLPSFLHGLFTKTDYFDRLDPRFVLSIRNKFPGFDSAMFARMLKSPMTQDEKNLTAYLIPALLNVMDREDRIFAAYEIAMRIHPKYFQLLDNPDYFKVRITSYEQHWELENNGRTLRYIPDKNAVNKTTAVFRNQIYELDHTHFHLERGEKEREYVILDAKYESVGEIHTVFRKTVKKPGDTHVQFMAVGVPLTIGKHNLDLDVLFDARKPVIDYQKLFMKTLDPDNAWYHSWGSLISKTPGFVDGLRFNLAPEPIEISEEQYKFMKDIFGTLKALDPNKILEPIDRQTGGRDKFQIRLTV